MNDDKILEIGKYFKATVKFDYNTLNYYILNMNPKDDCFKTYQEIEQKGKIISITVDTSLYIPYKYPMSHTKVGVERKFDTKIAQTHCEEDGSNYSNGPVDYLIEVEL
ncbi:MAG: hypothetical protein EOM50_23120 [Erysipelotrichia bacterium]|nr:hypothetical protein [Erysipelotrichia bacterium]